MQPYHWDMLGRNATQDTLFGGRDVIVDARALGRMEEAPFDLAPSPDVIDALDAVNSARDALDPPRRSERRATMEQFLTKCTKLLLPDDCGTTKRPRMPGRRREFVGTTAMRGGFV